MAKDEPTREIFPYGTSENEKAAWRDFRAHAIPADAEVKEEATDEAEGDPKGSSVLALVDSSKSTTSETPSVD